MIKGAVTHEGEPIVPIPIGGKLWNVIIDTGFNGFLELPQSLSDHFNKKSIGSYTTVLAGGLQIEEHLYAIRFPFEGKIIDAEVAFAPVDTILIGTRLLNDYHLDINFVEKTVLLERSI